MRTRKNIVAAVTGLVMASCMSEVGLASDEIKILSPDGNVQFKLFSHQTRLNYAVTFMNKPAIEASPVVVTVDGVNFAESAEVGKVDRYEVNETYPSRGDRDLVFGGRNSQYRLENSLIDKVPMKKRDPLFNHCPSRL